MAADATIGAQALRGSGGRGAVWSRRVGAPADTHRPTATAAIADPTASTTYGPRQPTVEMRTARIGAPTRRAIAHDVSNTPIARPRAAKGTR